MSGVLEREKLKKIHVQARFDPTILYLRQVASVRDREIGMDIQGLECGDSASSQYSSVVGATARKAGGRGVESHLGHDL